MIAFLRLITILALAQDWGGGLIFDPFDGTGNGCRIDIDFVLYREIIIDIRIYNEASGFLLVMVSSHFRDTSVLSL